MKIELSDAQVSKIAEAVADIVMLRMGTPNKKNDESSMTIKDVAEYIKRSVISVRRLIRQDKSFPVPRGKGKFIFDRKEIEIWWEKQKKKAEKIFRP